MLTQIRSAEVVVITGASAGIGRATVRATAPSSRETEIWAWAFRKMHNHRRHHRSEIECGWRRQDLLANELAHEVVN
jgi:NADP-dependent 3-hydroxy acid dehydrogenase YdfG